MNSTMFPVTPEDIPRAAGTDIGRSPAFDGKTGRFLVEKEPSTGFGPVTCALRGRCSAS